MLGQPLTLYLLATLDSLEFSDPAWSNMKQPNLYNKLSDLLGPCYAMLLLSSVLLSTKILRTMTHLLLSFKEL